MANPPEKVSILADHRPGRDNPALKAPSVTVESKPHKLWFDLPDMKALAQLLGKSPGRIVQLLDHRFLVVKPWQTRGLMITPHCHELDPWVVGSTGIVCSILFDFQGWSVMLEHDNSALDPEQRWPTVPLSAFLRCTVPLWRSAP